MTAERRPSPPPLEPVASATGLLTDAEIDGLIAAHAGASNDGKLSGAGAMAAVRRSRVAFLKPDDGHLWLYEKLWTAARGFNERFFGVDITAIDEAIQLARYDASDQGFYDWHMDAGRLAATRKISITVQLSDPDDYDGGDLELLFRNEVVRPEKTRGAVIAFPSIVMHRVAPVTRGTRYSLVAWIAGPRWR